MKYLLIVLFLIGCGKSDDTETKETGIPFRNAVIIDSAGSEVGYSLGINSGYITAYISDLDIYVQADLQNGKHRRRPVSIEKVYFSESNCTGTAYIFDFYGEVGKSYIKTKDDRFYLVKSLVTGVETNSFMSWAGDCSSSYRVIPTEIALMEQANEVPITGAPFTLRY